MIDENIEEGIKQVWVKYSNLFPEDKTDLIDSIFTEVYDVLNDINTNEVKEVIEVGEQKTL